jgi:hypothetical protein
VTSDCLPWSFAEIAECDPPRAAMLASAPAPDLLVFAILARFKDALSTGHLRIGMEMSTTNEVELRPTLQFHVGETLSDQFFNAITGYRAQFRLDCQRGLDFNRNIIDQIRRTVAAHAPDLIIARRLSPEFNDAGSLEVPRDKLCVSLDPNLSKIWYCGRLITGDGHVDQLPSCLTGPRLRLPDGGIWACIFRGESNAWLDVKGAFLGAHGLYQPKDPIEGARKLAISGEA